MEHKKRLVGGILVLGALVVLAGLLAGCSRYANRSVRGAVLVLPPSADVRVEDLLITNWKPADDNGKFYVSYTSRPGKHRQVQWEIQLDQFDMWYFPQATFDDAAIYYVAGARLLALNRADGTVLWEAPLSDLMGYGCPRCIQRVGDSIVVLTTDYVLQGIDARTGEPTWSVRLNDSTTARRGFEVVNDQVALLDYVSPGEYEHAFHIFDPADGSLVRQVAPTCPPESQEYLSTDADGMFIQRRAGGSARAVFLYQCWGDEYAQSADLATGQVVWQVALPEELNMASADSSVLGTDTLYLAIRNGIWSLALDDGTTTNLVRELDPDYRFGLLAEQGGLILAQAQRTRGSTRYELWGLDSTGGIVWRRDIQTDTPLAPGGASADWMVQFTPQGGLVVVQVLDTDPEQVQVDMLDPLTGQVTNQTTLEIEWASLDAVSLGRQTAYLTVYGKVYAVDLSTGAIAVEWP